MGSILAMDHYQDVFNTGMDGPKVSVVTSLYTVYELFKHLERLTTDRDILSTAVPSSRHHSVLSSPTGSAVASACSLAHGLLSSAPLSSPAE